MKQTLTDANFPRTADLRVYHLGLRPGEVANRIVIVGTPSRAYTLAGHFDDAPKRFELGSERGFLTLTGRYKGVPMSVISIGMGHPNVDFFVREVRECLSGDMCVVRLGSCGSLLDVPVGSVVVPSSSVAVERNLDFDFNNNTDSAAKPYRVSKPAKSDEELHRLLQVSIEAIKPPGTVVVADSVNASADSFYSSQGRQTSFPDQNATLIDQLQAENSVATFEMETFWLCHLADCWNGRKKVPVPPAALVAAPSTGEVVPPPLATSPVTPTASHAVPESPATSTANALAGHDTVIRAAAAQMVFASRTSQDFITPVQVAALEEWTGKGVLDALAALHLDRIHAEEGSVWEIV